MTEMKNVDDVLVKSMNEQLSGNNQPKIPDPIVKAPEPEKSVQEEATDIYGASDANEGKSPEIDEKAPEIAEKSPSEGEKASNGQSSPIDEYGNPTEKPKMYTEDELQRILRERLARNRNTETPTRQELKEIREDFKPDSNSEESWETQLEDFITKTIDKRQRKQSEDEWKARETQKQADFEEKFNVGMNRYKDFHDVVRGKPITDTMMLAARDLENPAAFIYAAAKLHPQELDRISKIPDSYAQAAAVGRLHEKMIKVRTHATNSKPIEVPKGDMAAKSIQQPSLESRIHAYGEQKRRR